MLRHTSSLVVVAAATTLALTSGLASALDEQDVITCDGLASPEEQFACFDAVVESIDEAAEIPMDDAPDGQSVASPSVDSQLSRDRSSILKALEAPSIMESDNLYRNEIVIQNDFGMSPLEATIVSVRVHNDGRYSVELDNGEIWRETRRETRVWLPKVGDAVEIYKDGPGGYRMRIEGNARVAWVRRSDELN